MARARATLSAARIDMGGALRRSAQPSSPAAALNGCRLMGECAEHVDVDSKIPEIATDYGERMTDPIFTWRSTTAATVIGVATGGLFGVFGDAPWQIAGLAGLAAGVLAVTVPLQFGGASALRFPPGLAGAAPGAERQRAVAGILWFLLVSWTVMIAVDWQQSGTLVLRLSLLLTGLAMFGLGTISGALGRFENDEADVDQALLSHRDGIQDIDGTKVRVFTVRSVAVGTLTGVIVVAVLNQALGTPLVLAAMTGFAAAACGLATFVTLRDRRLNVLRRAPTSRRPGVLALFVLVMIVSTHAGLVGVVLIRSRATESDPMVTVGSVFMVLVLFTAVASLHFGGMLGVLNQIDGGSAAEAAHRREIERDR